MSKVLVTGAAGYIGSVLVGKLLEVGHSVVGIDNLMYSQQSLLQYVTNPNFEFVWGDVRDHDLVNGLIDKCDIFIPLASIVGAPACSRDPMSSSVDLAITNYSLKSTPTIYPMSNSGYGTQSGEIYCTEKTTLEPISEYGQQKVKVENWLFNNNPNVISLRLATVFGVSPRMRIDLLVNSIVWELVTKNIFCLSENTRNNNRNFVEIKDVSSCFIHCIDNFNTMKGESYNLGNDSLNMTLGEMTYLIANELDSEVVISKHYADVDKRNYIVSNDKLRKMGFVATTGIREEIHNIAKACNILYMLNYGRFFYKNA